MVGCDANIHHRDSWGDNKARGESILEFTLAYTLNMGNVDNLPIPTDTEVR